MASAYQGFLSGDMWWWCGGPGLVLEPLPTGAWAFLTATTVVATKTLTFSQCFSAFCNDVIWLIVVSFFFAKVLPLRHPRNGKRLTLAERFRRMRERPRCRASAWEPPCLLQAAPQDAAPCEHEAPRSSKHPGRPPLHTLLTLAAFDG